MGPKIGGQNQQNNDGVGPLFTGRRVHSSSAVTLIYNKHDKEPALVVEVDGYRYHIDNKEQTKRDEIKDRVLYKIGLPVLRIRTNESGEKAKLTEALVRVISDSASV